MNKIGLAVGVTALSTLALCGGAFGLLSKNPKFQNLFGVKVNNDEIVSKLKNDILNKDKEIANLQNSNSEKDNQILGQQATIEELNELLAGSKQYNIEFTEDMSFPAGVTLLNVTDEIVLFSGANNKSTTGLWKFVKSTGKTTKVLDGGYNYRNLLKMSDGRILMLSEAFHTYAICDVSFNEFTFYDLSKSYLKSTNNEIKTYENEIYFVFGHSGYIWSFNKQTNNIISISDYFLYCYIEDNYLVSFYSSTKGLIYSLEDGSKETFESTSQYVPFKTEKGVYLLSSTGLSKFDYETRTITLLQDGLTISKFGNGVKLYKDGIYFNTSDNSNPCTLCLIDINEEKISVLGSAYVKDIIGIDNTGDKFLFEGFSSYYYFNRISNTFKSLSSVNNLLVLNSDYLVYNNTSSVLHIYDLNQLKSVLSFDINGFKVNSFEDLGEGKYKLIADDGVGIFDSVNTTFTFISVVIE